MLTNAGMTSAVVLLLVGAAMAFKTVASLSHTPEMLADFILGLSDNPLMLLFLINLLLFIVGMFLDAGPAIIILGPILGPIFVSLGRRSGAFRHHHGGQPDGRPAHAADGAGAVRHLVGVRPAGRNHRPRHPALPRRRSCS